MSAARTYQGEDLLAVMREGDGIGQCMAPGVVIAMRLARGDIGTPTRAEEGGEFGIQQGGQRFIPFSMTTDDIYALGNKVTGGMPLVLSFYWDETPATRAWTERFKKATGKMPTDPQANVYSAVLHYLKAVKAAGTTDTKAVLAKMKSMPVERA